jgi:hypothetical protein
MFSGETGSLQPNIVRSCLDDWKARDGLHSRASRIDQKHDQNNDVCRSSFLGFFTRLAGALF